VPVLVSPCSLSVLILEDQGPDFELIDHELRNAGFTVHSQRVETEEEYLDGLDAGPDIILADYSLPGFNALRALELLQARPVSIPFIVLTGQVTEDTVVECMRKGAADYLLKDRLARLGPAVRRALEDNELRQQKSRMETALRKSNERFQHLVEKTKVIPWEFDLETARFTYVGPQVVGLLGYPVEDWYEQDKKELSCLSHALSLSSLNDAGEFTHCMHTQDGATIHLQCIVSLKQEGSTRVLRGFMMDITEIKAKEMEMQRAYAEREAAEERASMAGKLVQANRELEAANWELRETHSQLIQTEKMASLGQLVAGIAHEINNPLAFVMNNLFTIEQGIDLIAPEAEPHLNDISQGKLRKVRNRLREMKEGLDRVKALVLNLRTFSRLDEGEFKTIDVGESIDSVLLLLHHKMIGRIQVETQHGPERTLYCHGGRLNQVFMNLIGNAMDSIAGEGEIQIATGREGEFFFISVKDTGKGIPEGIRTRIFDPFFTTKPVGKGTGLGLSISYGIVQDHQGLIEVRSTEGIGSEFIVKIPRDLETKRAA
jgi:signal transduction histidine kinase/DNA-binding NarL/FixJ family response regulator